ncbi:MAG: hypothetical protein ABFS14_02680 [Gemmatimonadota bacterium]
MRRDSAVSGPDSPLEAALRWLEPRLVDVPAELSAEIERCVRAAAPTNLGSDTVAATLAAGALTALDMVIAAPQTRDSAPQLLAADACLTYAFESAAERRGDLAGLAERLGLRGELGARLRAALAADSGPA